MKMRAPIYLCVLSLLASIFNGSSAEFRKLSLDDYRDKMKAGWIGQIAGVCWGAPTEFRFKDAIIPEDQVPPWKPSRINDAFGQDDLYVEMTFLRSLEEYGLNVSIRQAGIDFANSRYPLWCANDAGRRNLRRGIAPPDSGHPKFNRCPNDIDYQIEADYSGLIAPGLPQVAVDLGEKFGRLMNYGDGMYAGQFIGALYAAAFFENDIVKLINTALLSIPAQSQYAEMVRDMLAWYQSNPDDWQKTWQLCQDKYRKNPEYQKASNGGIDCKINGAYVLMGLLYGKKNIDNTILISCRSGMDSDCNPSSSAGVLCTTMGFRELPDKFTKELNQEKIFSFTAYNVPKLLAVCEKLARQIVLNAGGKIETENGKEYFLIPIQQVKPSALELSWAPGPIANSRFSEDEMARITAVADLEIGKAVAKFAPGWNIKNCGQEMDPGIRAEFGGKKNVLVTHPLDQQTGCTLWKKVQLPAGEKRVLHVVVGHDPQGDFELIIKANGKIIQRKAVDAKNAVDHWLTIDADLSEFAGRAVTLELINQPTGWAYEAAYWAEIDLQNRK